MNINAFQEFGMDLSDETLTRQFAARLPECPEGQLQINLSGCIIDYKATSVLMDAACERLKGAKEPRELALVFNVKFHERLFLKWLFLGSKRLGLDQGTATDDAIRERLNQGLRDCGIKLEIRIVNPETQAEMQSFTYGQ